MVSSAERSVAARKGGNGLANHYEDMVFHGVGLSEIRGIGKLRWGTDASVDQTKPVDAGVVTIINAAVGDA